MMLSLVSIDLGVYSLLALAILSVWFTSSKIIPVIIFVGATIAAFAVARMGWQALPIMAIVAGISYGYTLPHRATFIKPLLAILLFIVGFLLFSHKLPGFYNWQVLNDVTISDGAAPYDLWLNFDKPLIGFFILLFFGVKKIEKSPLSTMLKHALPYIIITPIILLAAALMLGMVRVDVKMPEFSLLWLVKTLVLVCIVEEVFFRCFIQTTLAKWTKRFDKHQIISITFTAMIFAAFHLAGGYGYAFLSLLLGLACGAAYAYTKRVEAAIACHFSVNMLHFFFFTYPFLAVF